MRTGRVLPVAILLTVSWLPAHAQERSGPPVGGGAFSLDAPLPNPFEDETRIPFTLGAELFRGGANVRVSMRVYNLLHQVVAVPVVGREEGRLRPLRETVYAAPGRYVASWDGKDEEGAPVTPGPYFIQLQVGDRTQVRKVLLVR